MSAISALIPLCFISLSIIFTDLMSQPIEITSVSQWNTTLRAATAAGQTIICDFHAQWCGPCKTISPMFTKFASQYPQAVFLRVDVDALQPIASKYQVTAMPTFFALKGGKQLDTLRGADLQGLHSLIARHAGPNPPLPPDAEAAKEKGNKAFAAQDWNAAVDAYSEALGHAPKSPQLYANRSVAYLKMGTPESRPKATQDALDATTLDGTFPKGWVRLGDALLLASEFDTMGSEEGSRKSLEGAEEAFSNAVGLLEGVPSQLIEVQKKLDAVRAKIQAL